MGALKKSAKVMGMLTYPVWMPVAVFYNSFRRNTGQGSGVIKELYESVKVKPTEQQLTVGLIEAVEHGELPEEQILKLPRQRFVLFALACIVQIIYIIWETIAHGFPAPLWSTIVLAISLAASMVVYRVSTKTQKLINALHMAFKRTESRQERAIYKIALWYRFFLAKKRTYQFGCLMFVILSSFSFLTGSLLWAVIPLFAAICFFIPNIFSVQLRLWQLSQRRLSAEERGCLLYTSPSPRDGLLSRMPSSA